MVACTSVHDCVAPIGGETQYREDRTTKLLDSTLFSWRYGKYSGADRYPLPDGAWRSSSDVCVVGAVVGSSPHAHWEVEITQGPRANGSSHVFLPAKVLEEGARVRGLQRRERG